MIPSFPSPIVLIGGGGHSLVVADAARAAGFTILGIFDDRADCPAVLLDGGMLVGAIWGVPTGARAILALGSVPLRFELAQALRCDWATVLHPEACVSSNALIGSGVFIAARAVVNPHARLGDHSIVNTSAVVEHECVIGAHSHIAPGAVLGGNVTVGDGTLVGLGSRVLPGVRLGRRCVVGAGAVVTRDVPDGVTVLGCPARQSQPFSNTLTKAS